MTHSSCAHDTIKTTCILHISHNIKSQFSHDQTSVRKDDEHSLSAVLAWKSDCVNCHAVACKCMTKEINALLGGGDGVMDEPRTTIVCDDSYFQPFLANLDASAEFIAFLKVIDIFPQIPVKH